MRVRTGLGVVVELYSLQVIQYTGAVPLFDNNVG